jgi:hypothetical protein
MNKLREFRDEGGSLVCRRVPGPDGPHRGQDNVSSGAISSTIPFGGL